jgi:hypothetical protein
MSNLSIKYLKSQKQWDVKDDKFENRAEVAANPDDESCSDADDSDLFQNTNRYEEEDD